MEKILPNNAPNNAIEIKGLTKIYKDRKTNQPLTALNNIDLTIPRGSLFALLGPNGAGKSTLINILVGLVNKTQGQVNIWNYDIDSQTRQSRYAIGVVPQEINMDPFFSPYALLELHAGLYGVPKHKRRTDEILEMVGLSQQRYLYVRSMSGGMRRRLLIAKALVHNPPVLVLDEPTAGVDIELRQQLWENVKALNQLGTTVLLTTHYLEEAEQLCDHIAIIDKGNLVANEPKKRLISKLDAKILQVMLDKPLDIIPANLSQFDPTLEKDAESGHALLQFSYKPSTDMAGRILTEIANISNLSIRDVRTIEADLEDIFLQLTSKQDPKNHR